MLLVGEGYTKKIIRIEYEWEPPRCGTCLLYGHLNDDCPKACLKHVVNGTGNKSKVPILGATNEVLNDGSTTVKQKVTTYKRIVGVFKTKKMEYRPVAPKNTKASPPKDLTKKASMSK